jgi:hypothetical protein
MKMKDKQISQLVEIKDDIVAGYLGDDGVVYTEPCYIAAMVFYEDLGESIVEPLVYRDGVFEVPNADNFLGYKHKSDWVEADKREWDVELKLHHSKKRPETHI